MLDRDRDELARASDGLENAFPVFRDISIPDDAAAALAETGPLPLRRRAGGFGALAGAIVSQQVSVAAADATQLSRRSK